ncbi:MAG TPA: adenosylcobinamide-GDP ribazoletransferase [Dongiaceae bacterium]
MDDPQQQDNNDFSPDAWRRDFIAAVMFLTRLRLPSAEGLDLSALKRASRLFAAVGVLIGLAGGIVYAVTFEFGFAPWLAAAFAVAATILISGGLHEDGLADTADGFAGGAARDDKLAIMRDSRIGTFGTLALIFSVLIRVAALASLTDIGIVMAALIAAHATSRAAMTGIMHYLPNARRDGLSAGVGRPDRAAAIVGVATAIVVAALLLVQPGLLALIVAGAAAAGLAWLAQRQIGGQTGDVLGAVEQVAQTAFLAALTLVL